MTIASSMGFVLVVVMTVVLLWRERNAIGSVSSYQNCSDSGCTVCAHMPLLYGREDKSKLRVTLG